MKIINKKSFYSGIMIIVLQVLIFLRYLRTGCISMPQVQKMCGSNAEGPLIGLAIFALVGVVLLILGLNIITKSTNKD